MLYFSTYVFILSFKHFFIFISVFFSCIYLCMYSFIYSFMYAYIYLHFYFCIYYFLSYISHPPDRCHCNSRHLLVVLMLLKGWCKPTYWINEEEKLFC